jgi:two-component system NarL family sensor kinase
LSGDDALRERLLAERDERRRIAETLHDGPVQNVAALSQMIDAVVRALDAGDAAAARPIAARSLEVARDAATELREIVSGLEPVTLDELGLPGALGELAQRTVGRRGATVELSLVGTPAPGPGASSGLFQIAREALDQAVRRGPPRSVRIVVSAGATGGVELSISDDAAPERRQTVMDGLAERAAELNATFSAERVAERTVISVAVPPATAAL